MKCKALKSFAGRGINVSEGDVFDLPDNADFVAAGLAEPVSDAVDVSEYHVGGGWYEVPGHDKKVRKDEAEALCA